MKSLLLATIASTLFVGCGSHLVPVQKVKPVVQPKPTPQVQPAKRQQVLPPPPPSTHVDKVVEDTNYQEQYMYPEDGPAAKKDPKVLEKKTEIETSREESQEPATASVVKSETMSKEACIAMIGQEKFDKYSKMFGSEEASIKRCGMMKAMQKN